ncbi:MAG: septum formation protein Maf [candidate division WOR-3 bacterium]|nr:MAG: septum formation protein Maf [candidate division WOR-3 bacterium]
MSGADNGSAKKLILASKSPRRLALLSTIVPADRIIVVESDVDETIAQGETAEAYCLRIAQKKALAAWDRYDGNRSDIAVVVGADTVVLFEDEIIGQPRDEDDAMCILKTLAGRRHEVMTGVALLGQKSCNVVTFSVKSVVWMKELDLEMIREYVATGEPFDKAGAYAIQGEGRKLIAKYAGSYSNIVGLPMDELTAVLSRVLI